MRRVVVPMSVSLDGFFAGPEGELDWQLVDEELHTYFNEHLRTMGAFVSGRVTYELMAQFWPTVDAESETSPAMLEFADIWRDMPKIVYSSTLEAAEWNTTIRRAVDVEEVRALKESTGGDLALGGAVLAESFQTRGLVDEYRLYVHPVVLGHGRAFFATSDVSRSLHLMETRTFGNGVVMLRYAVAE